jgi:hypothetical protein
MFYTVRFNASLAAIGINPTLVPSQYRELGQVQGKANRCTPQEAVILVLGELPIDFHMIANPNVAKLWVHQGKLDLDNRAIQLALLNIGWELN